MAADPSSSWRLIVYGELVELLAKKYEANSAKELAAMELVVVDVGFGLGAFTFMLASLGMKVLAFDKDDFPNDFVKTKLLPTFSTTFRSITDAGRGASQGRGQP